MTRYDKYDEELSDKAPQSITYDNDNIKYNIFGALKDDKKYINEVKNTYSY